MFDVFPISAWEARMDSHGRVFYIDHATRTTSWTRPGGAANIASNGSGAEQQRRQLDRRYQSIRRTISSHQIEAMDQAAPPGCKLLTRPDFFTILHMNEVCSSAKNNNLHSVTLLDKKQNKVGYTILKFLYPVKIKLLLLSIYFKI